jgi:DNA uptake protein ComE-like DNA-binding protein
MKKLVTTMLAAACSLLFALPGSFAADQKAPAKAPEAAKPAKTEKKGESAPAAKVDSKAALVDINTATEAELKTIPGIGDAYSKKIIAGRPYERKDQLKSMKIMPATEYEKIKDKIIAKQPKK